jgi:hypothetical protein
MLPMKLLKKLPRAAMNSLISLSAWGTAIVLVQSATFTN